MSEQSTENTDREIWREVEDDYYAPSIFVTEQGMIKINVGGFCFVKSVQNWHALAVEKEGNSPQDLEQEELERLKRSEERYEL